MMMPDVNLLVAVGDTSHKHHPLALAWFQANSSIATCAITELGMLRILIQLGTPARLAEASLAALIASHRKQFVECDLSALALQGKIRGHGQVTDRYLVELCARHSLTLATFDQSIAGAHLVQ